ncbi:rCG41933 [Rattus norvegicus]|uniref:RCG41933 n=1 Tax=Rattus norvegicus TaxID=10116 RepID=A6KKK6_RAT|nr:rCG41933 [Rattus norvegicus]
MYRILLRPESECVGASCSDIARV